MRMQRGFTVLEMMVGGAIAMIVAFGCFALITGQVEGYNRQERVSVAQMLVRSAMMEVTKRVTPTGMGIPPDWAVTPGSLNNVTSGVMDTCPNTDVLEVRTRDPHGYWNLGPGSSPSLLNFTNPAALTADYKWLQGQRLFVFASLGYYSLVRTSALRAIGSGSVALSSPESQDLLTPGNATVGQSSQVYLVNTTRLRVTCTDPLHPLLVVEDDLDEDGNGVVDINDQIPIASDIEDMQIAYLIDKDRDGIVTDADAYNHPLLATDPNFLTPTDNFRAVKGVRISLVGKAKALPNTSSAPLIVEDHSPPQTPDDYVRRLLRQVIIFDNRDTSDPSSYLHLSNQVL
jgi:type IV pilus assembly protein PilW